MSAREAFSVDGNAQGIKECGCKHSTTITKLYPLKNPLNSSLSVSTSS